MNLDEIHERALRNCLFALQIVKRFENNLLKDDFLSALRDYEKSIEETAFWMKKLKIWEECAICGNSPKGSCCAPEVALWYDLETIVINILMGCKIPPSPYKRDHCFFLGEKGCLLKARHYYCVTFLCPPLANKLSPQEKGDLYKVIGREIGEGSRLIAMVSKYVSIMS